MTNEENDKNAARLFIRLKALSRDFYILVERKRNEVDAEKLKIEKLKLKLDNLQYKKSHIRRAIQLCNDLQLPSIKAIEEDLHMSITIKEFADIESLLRQHNDLIDMLEEEKNSRLATKKTLEDLHQELVAASEVLEKKRVFFEERLPLKVRLLKENALLIKQDFDEVIEHPTIDMNDMNDMSMDLEDSIVDDSNDNHMTEENEENATSSGELTSDLKQPEQ